jgi:hypothetical protein
MRLGISTPLPLGWRLFAWQAVRMSRAVKRSLLSVFSTVDHKVLKETSFAEAIGTIAVSADGKHLFVAVGPRVIILKADDLQAQEGEIQTCAMQGKQTSDCWPTAIALSDKGGLYILSQNGRLQFSGLSGPINP